MRFSNPSVAPSVSATISGGTMNVGTVGFVNDGNLSGVGAVGNIVTGNLSSVATITNPVFAKILDAPVILINTTVTNPLNQGVITDTSHYASIELALRYHGTAGTPPVAATWCMCQVIWYDPIGGGIFWVDNIELLTTSQTEILNKYCFVKLPIRGPAISINFTAASGTTDLIAWGSLREVNSVVIQHDGVNFLMNDNIVCSGAGTVAAGATSYVFGGVGSGPAFVSFGASISGAPGVATNSLRFRPMYGSSGLGPGDTFITYPAGGATIGTSYSFILPRRPLWFSVFSFEPVKSQNWNLTVVKGEPTG